MCLFRFSYVLSRHVDTRSVRTVVGGWGARGGGPPALLGRRGRRRLEQVTHRFAINRAFEVCRRFCVDVILEEKRSFRNSGVSCNFVASSFYLKPMIIKCSC